MGQPGQPEITPLPSDEEAAAIIAAISAYLAEQPAPQPHPAPRTRPWAIAGWLASQGQAAPPLPGVRTNWANVARLTRISGQ
jgi:hypothetical protein